MRAGRGWLWCVVAACAHPAKRPTATHTAAPPPSEPSPWSPRTTRSAPTPFFDLPGLQQVHVSTYSDDEFGYSNVASVELLRDGKVVCELPFGGSEAHENHGSFSTVELVLGSRVPLRFYVKTATSSRDFGSVEECAGFELRDGASCQRLFERGCTEAACTMTYTTVLSPGSGKVHGMVTREGQPLLGAVLQVESRVEISDERGAFAIDAGVGTHEITVIGTERTYAPNPRVSLGRHQDAEVTIAIACPCCEP